jgi:hypothetical protein
MLYEYDPATLRLTSARIQHAEVLLAGGVSVTRLRAELLAPGIALTAAKMIIDKISAALISARPIEPILVERSRHLGGDW